MSFESFFQDLRARWLRWRNRMIASPAFQRRAAAFPLSRPIARHYARDLFDLAGSFIRAQVATALVESGLLAALARSPMTLEEAAAQARLTPQAAAALLRGAEALALAERAGGRWTLGTRGAAMAGSPGLVEMIAHHRLLYADLADPLATLRGEGPGRLAALWRYGSHADPEAVATYSRLMAESQPMVSAQAFAAYDFSSHSRLLDVGAGTGAFLSAVAERYPALGLGAFDLPAVTGRSLAPAGTARHEGDFHSDPLPDGYDVMTLVRVLHDHDDAPAASLLSAIRAALKPGGRLLIVEPMAGARGAAASIQVYFSLYLAAMGQGRPRTPSEIAGMLRAAGFRNVMRLPTPLPLAASVIKADNPSVTSN